MGAMVMTPPRRRRRFYVMRTHSRPGWLFSLCVGPYLIEGCTLWRSKLWIGRRTYV